MSWEHNQAGNPYGMHWAAMTSVCGTCGAVYWTTQGHKCKGRPR